MNSGYRASHTRDGYARHYDQIYGRGYFYQLWNDIESPILRAELVSIRDAGGFDAIDFACGTGRVTTCVAETFPTVEGIDVSDEMLARARERYPEITFTNVDVTRHEIRRQVDVITAFRFFLNAEDQLRAAVLDALYKMLRPQGVLIASFQWSERSPAGRAHALRKAIRRTDDPRVAHPNQIIELFSEHGFIDIRVRHYGLWPSFGQGHGRLGAMAMSGAERAVGHSNRLDALTQNFLVIAHR
jgi:SAM-dependent methyltransferase